VKSWRTWITLAVLVLLHFLLHLGVGIRRGAPDLLTLGVLLASRELRIGSASGMGFALGLLEDAFSVLSFGTNTIALTITAAIGSRSRDLFVGESAFFMLSYLFLGKWLRDLVYWVVVGDAVRGSFQDVMVLQASLAAIYVAIVGMVIVAFGGTQGNVR
jgi:rod shape-determining protein MreD